MNLCQKMRNLSGSKHVIVFELYQSLFLNYIPFVGNCFGMDFLIVGCNNAIDENVEFSFQEY